MHVSFSHSFHFESHPLWFEVSVDLANITLCTVHELLGSNVLVLYLQFFLGRSPEVQVQRV